MPASHGRRSCLSGKDTQSCRTITSFVTPVLKWAKNILKRNDKISKVPVVFNEENHTYFLGEKQLRGITGMISRQLFPDKYKGVPDHVMRRAATRAAASIHNANL